MMARSVRQTWGGFESEPPPGPTYASPRLTPVVRALIVANVAIYLSTFLMSVMAEGAWIALRDELALNAAVWKARFPFLPLWQIVSYGFLHDTGSPFHVLFNMLGLYFFGGLIERAVGSRRFLVLYGSALVIAGLAQVGVGLWTGDRSAVIGASGAVLALVTAGAVLEPRMTVFFLFIPITLAALAVLYVAIDLLNFLQSWKTGMQGGVAHVAHLSGAAFGFIAARSGWIWVDPMERYEGWKAARGEDKRQEDAARLDQLLAKISREGIGSLSSAERDFLRRTSRKN